MDFGLILQTLPDFLSGLWLTILFTVSSLAIGLALSVPLAIARSSPNPLINWPVFAYTYFFRGTPLFIQLLLIYYGSGQFEWVKASWAWSVLQHAWFCALLAFVLNTTAYTTEILRGAIEATPHGEIEAAKASGMSRFLMFRRIILPSAFRRALPAYGNECVFMMHGTSVAGLVTLMELTGVAQVIQSRFYSPFEAFGTAAVFYMGLTFTIVAAFHALERRYHRHLRPRS